jgi:hypothetical protein
MRKKAATKRWTPVKLVAGKERIGSMNGAWKSLARTGFGTVVNVQVLPLKNAWRTNVPETMERTKKFGDAERQGTAIQDSAALTMCASMPTLKTFSAAEPMRIVNRNNAAWRICVSRQSLTFADVVMLMTANKGSSVSTGCAAKPLREKS